MANWIKLIALLGLIGIITVAAMQSLPKTPSFAGPAGFEGGFPADAIAEKLAAKEAAEKAKASGNKAKLEKQTDILSFEAELNQDVNDLVAAKEEEDHTNPALAEYDDQAVREGKINFKLLAKTKNAEEDAPDYPPLLDVLDNKPIEIIGFMTPYDDLDSMKKFMVVSFPTGCQFCGVPRLQEVLFCESAASAKPWPFVNGPLRIRGTLQLKRPERIPKETFTWRSFIYKIVDAKVELLDP